MLACTALVGCTNEDVIDNPNENQNPAVEAKAYVSVKFVTSTSNGSRSTTDKGYEAADPELEKKIFGANSIFLFYEEDGSWVTSGVVSDETPNGNDATDGDKSEDVANDVEGNAYVVLQGTQSDLSQCTKVLTVINYSDCESLKQLTLQQALNKIATTAADPAEGTGTKGFLMSTSVYKDAETGDIINYTAIDGKKHICATTTLAEQNPVIIHVERAAAKVDVAVTETTTNLQLGVTGTDNEDKGIVVNGVITPVQITIDGWTLNGINETTNIVKQLDNAWLVSGAGDVPFANWNNATDYRSFWTKSTNYDRSKTLTYKYPVDATEKADGEAVQYCYENNVDGYIIDYNKVTENHKVTTVLVKAHFNLISTDANLSATQTFYEFNGVYYTHDNYMNLIMKQLKDAGYRIITENTADDGTTTTTASTLEAAIVESTTAADGTVTETVKSGQLRIVSDGTLEGIEFTVETLPTGSYYAQVEVDDNGEIAKNANGDEIITIVKKDDVEVKPTNIEIADWINELQYVAEAEAYKNGECIYQVPIEHLAATPGTKTYTEADGVKKYNFVEGYYGVVRNHHYKLKISAIKNIGEPVYDEEKVKITDIPAKLVDYYMAAELHVLNWHLVEQDVTLD